MQQRRRSCLMSCGYVLLLATVPVPGKLPGGLCELF
jgi:hypothetical protein